MTIGIIGAGEIGRAFARQLVRAGIDVAISNSRGPDSLADIVRELGPRVTAVTVAEAARADIVLVSVPWQHLPAALADLPNWNGRVVIDATNPIVMPGFRMAELDGRASSEVVADLIPGARLVKAFNTLTPGVLASDPREGGGRRVIFFSGDDATAKKAVAGLIDRLGFSGVDLGTLAGGGRLQQFPGGPLPALNLVRLG